MLNDKLKSITFINMAEKFKFLKADSGTDCSEKKKQQMLSCTISNVTPVF